MCERERQRVCVCKREKALVCVCVCVSEREIERVCVCVCLNDSEVYAGFVSCSQTLTPVGESLVKLNLRVVPVECDYIMIP